MTWECTCSIVASLSVFPTVRRLRQRCRPARWIDMSASASLNFWQRRFRNFGSEISRNSKNNPATGPSSTCQYDHSRAHTVIRAGCALIFGVRRGWQGVVQEQEQEQERESKTSAGTGEFDVVHIDWRPQRRKETQHTLDRRRTGAVQRPSIHESRAQRIELIFCHGLLGAPGATGIAPKEVQLTLSVPPSLSLDEQCWRRYPVQAKAGLNSV